MGMFWIGNPIIATGLMSFWLHEVCRCLVYFFLLNSRVRQPASQHQKEQRCTAFHFYYYIAWLTQFSLFLDRLFRTLVFNRLARIPTSPPQTAGNSPPRNIRPEASKVTLEYVGDLTSKFFVNTYTHGAWSWTEPHWQWSQRERGDVLISSGEE